MTTIFKKFATGTAVLALTATVFATGTMAEEPLPSETTTSTIIEGQTGVEIVGDIATSPLAGTLLTGETQTVTGDGIGTFDVIDARGTGAGWNIAVSATEFTQPDGKSLSAGSLTLAAPTVELIDLNSSAIETVATNGGTIDGGSVKILSAEANAKAGMGGYTISPMAMELKLKPKEVYEGTYTSTVTVALTTGP